MPRQLAKDLNPQQYNLAYELFCQKEGTGKIKRTITSAFGSSEAGGEAVSERTIDIWIQGFKRYPRDVVDDDATFLIHLAEEYGIPWEHTGFILDLQYTEDPNYLNAKFAEILASAEDDVRPFLVLPHYGAISFREARWAWRVHLMAPEIGTAVGYLADVRWLARKFANRERARAVNNLLLDTTDLQALLTYRPWLDESRHESYHKAVERRSIPGVAQRFIFDSFKLKATNMVKTILAHPVDEGDLPTWSWIEGFREREFHNDHPELLMSQQMAAYLESSLWVQEIQRKHELRLHEGDSA